VAYLIVNRSEGKLNFKKLQQSCITSLLTGLNNFIKNRDSALVGTGKHREWRRRCDVGWG